MKSIFEKGQYLILDRGVGHFLLVEVIDSSPLCKTKVRILNENIESWELNLVLHDLESGLELIQNHLRYTQKLADQVLQLIMIANNKLTT